LVEEIARGGMGVVYRARQLNLNREVAVKLMLHGALASTADVDRFRAEARNAAALRHPHIIAIHEVGEWEGQHYFSMDLIEGRSLAEITREAPVNPRRAAALSVEIASAVQHAHEQGILHRDLKPSNVIVDAAGHAHVTDFGLSRSLQPGTTLTQAGHALGTPGFMAPEQAGGATRSVGVPADVYGLGALLYQLLTGRAPFTGDNIAEVLRRVAETEVVSPRLLNPEVPRDLETICLKCLAKEPEGRYRTAALLGDDLGLFLRDKPIRARPQSLAVRTWRWSRRNPATAALGATVMTLLLALALGSVLAAVRFERARQREAALRVEAARRLQQGEKLIEFMLGDLADKLEPVGRLDVLDGTIAKIDEFYSQVPTAELTPDSERNRANALFQAADIRSIAGHFPEAIAGFTKAIAAYGQLIAKHPEKLQWQYELARTRNDYGLVFVQQHDYERAYAVLGECLREREALVRQQPNNVVWLAALGVTAHNLAQVCRHTNRLDEAGRLLALTQSAERQWVAADPHSVKARERLAVACGTFGQYLDDLGKFDEAAASYLEKKDILESLLRDDPQNSILRFDHANCFSLIGDLEYRRSNNAAAVRHLSQGIRELDALVAQDPANREWQLGLVNELNNRACALRDFGQTVAALEDFQRIADFSDKNPEPAHAYPEWEKFRRRALQSAAEILETQAAGERTAHADQAAADHEQQAARLTAKLRSLPE